MPLHGIHSKYLQHLTCPTILSNTYLMTTISLATLVKKNLKKHSEDGSTPWHLKRKKKRVFRGLNPVAKRLQDQGRHDYQSKGNK